MPWGSGGVPGSGTPPPGGYPGQVPPPPGGTRTPPGQVPPGGVPGSGTPRGGTRTPPPGGYPGRTTEGVLTTRRAVCLLRSRRRTFLFILCWVTNCYYVKMSSNLFHTFVNEHHFCISTDHIRSTRQGNVFTCVCVSGHRGWGESVWTGWPYPPAPQTGWPYPLPPLEKEHERTSGETRLRLGLVLHNL